MTLDYSIYYNKFHSDSDEHYRAMSLSYGKLLKPVLDKMPKSSKILDVGCGTGLLVSSLIDRGYRDVSGIDVSPQQIEIARERGLPCNLVEAREIYAMSQDSPSSYNAIFLLDVLEHIPMGEQLDFTRALANLLTPAGLLVVSVPNASASFASRHRYGDWTHACSFTEDSLEFVLRNAGFEVPQFLPYEYGLPLAFPYVHKPAFWAFVLRRLFRCIRRMEAIGELGRNGLRISLALNLLATCRKAS